LLDGIAQTHIGIARSLGSEVAHRREARIEDALEMIRRPADAQRQWLL
jgi:hypothetical protein